MKKIFVPLFLFVIIHFSLGCTKGGGAPETTPNPSVAVPEANITEEGYISLSKDALGKEFLLQASFIWEDGYPTGSPTSEGTQSRIVSFAQQKDSLFMMESTKGLLPSDELPAERILTEFKITGEKEGKITFDFNEGMKKLFLVSDWYGSDFGKDLPLWFKLDISHAFLKEVKSDPKRISIRQIAQVELPWVLFPVEVVYYLEPYLPDPSFKPTLSPGFRKMGFFEVNPTVRPEFGSLQNYISKWHFDKPIVFHISSNTPEEFQDAVKEGVLYWNKVFGVEVVQVAMAPKGITAPHPDYNIIQWVTNHSGLYAYADAQMDPRTGQILHGQIYFPSSFSVPTLDRLERRKKVEKDDKEQQRNFSPIGLKGFSSGLLCRYPKAESVFNPIPLKLVQDFVRNTIAHEVGHTLGLRHNFAGSMGSDLKPGEIGKIFEEYLKTGEIKNSKRVASSVMDYLPFEERILTGAYIGKKESEPLPYDAMAIQWAYYGVDVKKSLEEVLFCTDSSLWFQGYADCQARDRSGHPLLGAAFDFEEGVKNLPHWIAARYLAAKTYFDPEWRLPVEEVALDAGEYADDMTWSLSDFLGLLKDNVRSLVVERSFSTITDVNEKEVEEATTRWIDKGIKAGGGVKVLLNLIHSRKLRESLLRYPDDFNTIVENPKFREGQTLAGEPYTFSNREISKMEKVAKAFFGLLEEKVLKSVTERLVGRRKESFFIDASPSALSPGWDPPKPRVFSFRSIADLGGLEETLGQWAEYIITDNAEKNPTFDGEHRFLATSILQPFQGPKEDWQKENRERVLKLLLSKLEQRFGVSIDKIDPESLPEKEREALELERPILIALGFEFPASSQPASSQEVTQP